MVSIPFKRESVFRVRLSDGYRNAVIEFQFPSNGKVYSEEALDHNLYVRIKFQFPSNGKVYSELILTYTVNIDLKGVSIPFKRESVFRAIQISCLLVQVQRWFQFPSNGKVYSEVKLR